MAYNGSGAFTIDTAGNPVSSGTTIDPSVHNTTLTEIATGLTTAICKDGQTTITQNIPFNNKKITGLAAATARTDGASIATIQDGTGVYVASGSVGGTADVITLTPSPAITAYAAGQTFRFPASGTNTTNVTVNVSGLGAKAITKNGTTALVANDILSGMMVQITYDGTRFILGTHLTADVVTLTGTQTLTNKTMTSTTLTSPTLAGTPVFPDNVFTIGGSGDATKKLAFEVDGITTGTTRTLTVSDQSGTLPTIATQAEVNAMTSTTTALTPNHSKIIAATAVNTTSGTTIDFTDIPAGVQRITGMLSGVSTNGTNDIIVQIGDSGGIETSGYLGGSTSVTNYTTGFGVTSNGSAANVMHGIFTLVLLNSATNLWAYSSTMALSSSAVMLIGAGSKATSATLDRIRLTTVTGTDTFDAGSMNIIYER